MNLLTNILPSLLDGSRITLLVFFITLLFSIPLSIMLAAVQNLNNRVINKILWVYIYVERGTPLLLQLRFIYFGLPFLGVTLSRMMAIYVAFVLNYTAYFIEIFRSGIKAIDEGQFKACKVLGFSYSFMYWHIIIPQCLHNCLPSITNEVLNLIKDTTLISVLGAQEVLKAGRNAVNVYASAIPFIYVAIIYLIMTFVVTNVMNYIESRFNYYD